MSYNDSSKVFHPTATPTAATAAPPVIAAAGVPHETSHAPAVAAEALSAPSTTSSAPDPVNQRHIEHDDEPFTQPARSNPSNTNGTYPISAYVLRQAGAYQAHVVVRWTTADGRSGKTERLGSSIGFNHTGARSLKNKGIPEGALCTLELDVTLGKTSRAHESFVYEEGAPTVAYYVSGGTSLSKEKLTLVYGDE